MKNQYIRGVLAGCLLIGSSGTFADSEVVSGKILNTLSESSVYGKCMVYSESFNPRIACPAGWVSLDCSGDFNSKEDSRRMWDSAQLAYAMDLTVEVTLVDTQKHNGYCVAKRLNVTK